MIEREILCASSVTLHHVCLIFLPSSLGTSFNWAHCGTVRWQRSNSSRSPGEGGRFREQGKAWLGGINGLLILSLGLLGVKHKRAEWVLEMGELSCCRLSMTPAPLLFPATEVPQLKRELWSKRNSQPGLARKANLSLILEWKWMLRDTRAFTTLNSLFYPSQLKVVGESVLLSNHKHVLGSRQILIVL